jgi:hypothetical protein
VPANTLQLVTVDQHIVTDFVAPNWPLHLLPATPGALYALQIPPSLQAYHEEVAHCCYAVVTLLLRCCYTVVTLLLHCCYAVVTLLLHCCYTVVTLLSHYCHTIVTMLLH